MKVPPRSRGSALAKARSSIAARRLLVPAQKFVHTETTSGVFLLAAAIAALVWANSRWGGTYEALWGIEASLHVGRFTLAHTLREWINDALMVIFFFVVGLEVKREFVHGELREWNRASLPVVCALGGMLVPAALYFLLNHGGPAARGWAIPMATDIAFALGVLTLVGERVPAGLRVFLLALATVDDIGAILVITVFYAEPLSLIALGAALLLLTTMIAMQRFGVQNLLHYLPIAVLFWFAVLESGIHATIAGVVLGLITPTSPPTSQPAFLKSAEPLLARISVSVRSRDKASAESALGEMEELTLATEPPAERLIRLLHPWSSYLILPVFALANAGVSFTTEMVGQAIGSSATRGVLLGLIIGKLTGIALFAWLAVRLRIAKLMPEVRWSHMAGVGLLGGIGFTVSLFIADLAFTDPGITAVSRLAILLASLASGIAGYAVLRIAGKAAETS